MGTTKSHTRRTVPLCEFPIPYLARQCEGQGRDLRHTAASLAVQVGANVKAVQKMLGHASATTTWRWSQPR